MEQLTDRSLMPFGKYKGTPMINVPGVYLMWLHNQGCSNEGVKRYILNNLEVIRKEAAKVAAFRSR